MRSSTTRARQPDRGINRMARAPKTHQARCLRWVCAVQRRRFPVGASPTRQTLQPEAIGAVMEVTKWLKPSISVSRIGDSASVQAVTRVNAEQALYGVLYERGHCQASFHFHAFLYGAPRVKLIWGSASQALDLRHGLLSFFLPRGFFVRA